MNTNAETKQWQEEQALNRFRLIAPLLVSIPGVFEPPIRLHDTAIPE